MTNTKLTLELLNEKGKQVLELKNVLIQNEKNPLIYNGLLSSIKTEDYEKKLYDALINSKCNIQHFEAELMSYSSYTNEALLKQTFNEYRRKLSTALEKKGQDHFSSDVSVSNGGIEIIKKIGINLDFVRREFRLSTRELNKYVKEGFVDKYTMLKVSSIVKALCESLQKKFGTVPDIKFDTSKFYYDEDKKYYNMDLVITILLTENRLSNQPSSINELVKSLDEILLFVHKEYHKATKN